MKRRPFDGREQLVLSSAGQVPTQRYASQLGVHQHRSIAVIPRQPQQPGLSRAIVFQPVRQRRYRRAGTPRDRIENIAGRRKPRFDPEIIRMNRPFHHPAQTGNQAGILRHRHDASRRADHVHHIALANPRPDRVPMRIECPHGNRNARTQSQLRRPLLTQMSGQLVRRLIISADLLTHARQHGIHLRQEGFRRKTSEGLVPHPLVAHRADTARNRRGIAHAA